MCHGVGFVPGDLTSHPHQCGVALLLALSDTQMRWRRLSLFLSTPHGQMPKNFLTYGVSPPFPSSRVFFYQDGTFFSQVMDCTAAHPTLRFLFCFFWSPDRPNPFSAPEKGRSYGTFSPFKAPEPSLTFPHFELTLLFFSSNRSRRQHPFLVRLPFKETAPFFSLHLVVQGILF